MVGMVVATGCAPLFVEPTSPEGQASAGLYRSPERLASPASQGIYGVATPALPVVDGAPVPALEVSPPALETREPVGLVLRPHECCADATAVRIACAGGAPLEQLYDPDPPTPAPYKPWPCEELRAPPLYHAR